MVQIVKLGEEISKLRDEISKLHAQISKEHFFFSYPGKEELRTIGFSRLVIYIQSPCQPFHHSHTKLLTGVIGMIHQLPLYHTPIKTFLCCLFSRCLPLSNLDSQVAFPVTMNLNANCSRHQHNEAYRSTTPLDYAVEKDGFLFNNEARGP